MAETGTLPPVKTSEEAEVLAPGKSETQLSVKVMHSPGTWIPLQRVLISVSIILAIWIVFSLAVAAIRGWP